MFRYAQDNTTKVNEMLLEQGNAMKRGNKNFIYILLNAIIALLLAVIYTWIASYLLPEGVNLVFVERLWKRLFIMLPFTICGLALYLYMFNNKRISYSKAYEKVNKYEWLYAAIPIIPITLYVIANKDWLNLSNSILVLLFFSALSILICVIIPALLSVFAFKHLLMAVSTSLLFVLTNMASLSAHYSWHYHGDLYIQLAIFAVIFLVIAFSIMLPRQLVSLIIGLVFLANIFMAYTSSNNREVSFHKELEDLVLYKKLSGREIKRSNDIILLVYEAYANYETIIHYGYDNIDQLNFLKDNGFHIYHGIYSVGTPSIVAMSRVFNLEPSYVHEQYTAGGGAVQTLLREAGYESHSIFQNNYFFRNLNHDQLVCDNPFPPLRNEAITMIQAVNRGSFSDDHALEGVGYEAYVEKKHTILKRNNLSPSIIYTHSEFPGHGPCVGIEPEENQKYKEWYINQLSKANNEMRQDIRLAINKSEALIIIAGDHGPFVTKDGFNLNRSGNFATKDIDRYDIQDRFGAFLAIRWPETEYAKAYDIEILQDIFPAVFAYLYDDEGLFKELRMEQVIQESYWLLGVTVRNGIIVGGGNDGEPLFLYNLEEGN